MSSCNDTLYQTAKHSQYGGLGVPTMENGGHGLVGEGGGGRLVG